MRKKPTTKSGKANKMEKIMGEAKRGKLHSGSKDGPKVTNPKQAIAIGLKESGQSKKTKMSRPKDKPSKDAPKADPKKTKMSRPREKLDEVTF